MRRVESYESVRRRRRCATTFRPSTSLTEWLRWLSDRRKASSGARRRTTFRRRGIPPHVAQIRLTASLGLTFRPTPRLRPDMTYLHSRLTGGPAGSSRSARVFSNHIARSTSNYQFTRDLVRARHSSTTTRCMPDRFAGPAACTTRRVGVDTLFDVPGGTFNRAVRGLHVRLCRDVALSAVGRPVVRDASTPGTVVGRQLFAKISYLFRT